MTGTLHVVTATAALTFLASGLSACTEGEQPGQLPTGTMTPTSPTPTSTEGLSDDQQVRTIYTEYTIHRPEAQDLSRHEQRQFLSQWTAEPFTTFILDAFAESKSNHERSYGHLHPQVMSVEISGSQATVNDCTDQTDYSYRNTRTGREVNPNKTDTIWTVTRLEKKANGWRIVRNSVKDKPCTD